jgi:hypothetical protein
MTEIPRQLIHELRNSLQGLGDAPQDMRDAIERLHGPSISVALDDLLAVSYQIVSAISTLGTVWRDCLAEGLRLIFIPVGVEDDEEPKDRASETRDDQSPCRASREEHPACDAQVAFF